MKLIRKHILILSLILLSLPGVANNGTLGGDGSKVVLAESAKIFLSGFERVLVVELPPAAVSNTNIYVFNVAFGTVYEGKAESVNNRIDLNNLPSGLYYVRLAQDKDEDVFFKKIVIK